ncbi:peptide-methionine (S)-S-oxide reductase MsrA [Xylophilus rhododendri]|uniref:Peptide methionine sulfoxide reductase MsrA n=2 Tax=Xylophilus rhododendri TaxID=2697032 RepID=A0A857JG76_9BURK|nr:peptide-methionine (S)-S-oxide reductase MsrA [Xylophilus rhododendri]
MDKTSTVSRTASASRRRFGGLALGAAVVCALAWQGSSFALGGAEEAVRIPAPAQDIQAAAAPGKLQKAVFAGGCFWGVQGVFQHVQGVRQAVSGYAGGAANTANYDTVSGGRTGHAEAVEVTYDPSQVSYGALLQVFFSVAHNPTQLNRQGPDTGTQYRSALFPVDEAQQRVAQAYIAQLDAAHVYQAPIVTKIEPRMAFYPAETYHQDFLTEHPNHGYIVINDLPKIAELQKVFPARYRAEPVLVKAARAS